MSAQAKIEASAAEPCVLREELSPGVVRVTMNRPKSFNALSEAMIDALQATFDAIAADEKVRVVVLAGAGKAFCPGHDLHEMRATPSAPYYEALLAKCNHLMLSIRRLPQPVIARVHGIATAAGCQLVAMCDLAVAADHVQFAVSGIKFGLFCGTPSVGLVRNMPLKQAMEMLLTGEFIDARTAVERALINHAVPAAGLDAAIAALCAKIVDKPPAAVRIGKELVYRQVEQGIADAYDSAAAAMVRNLLDEDALEGCQAFVEKRVPKWRTPQ